MLLRFLLKTVRQPALYNTSKSFSVVGVKSNEYSNGSFVRYSTRSSSDINKKENSTDELSPQEIRALQADSDSFGTLSSTAETSASPNPKKHDAILEKHNEMLLQKHADTINTLIKAQDVEEALKIFEEHVLARDQLHPPVSMFTHLLDYQIRYQMPEGAFHVLSLMIERQLNVSLDTIAKVIESCELLSQSSKKMNYINRYLDRTNQKATASICNGMIRCYIRSGQWKEGLALVDSMNENGLELEAKTFPFILDGWSYDPDNGFCKVLENWHEMQQRGCNVDVETLNALLKCIQKCEIGDIDKLNETINMIRSKYNETKKQENENQLSDETNKSAKFLHDGRPRLLHNPPLKGILLPFETVDNPEKRLLLLGGLSEFLKMIKSNEIVPTLNTILLLLAATPNTIKAENKVISLIGEHNIELNVEFYEQILARMSLRQDFEGAKSVIEWMKNQQIEMNMITFGLWAVSCKSVEHAQEFLFVMRNSAKSSRPGVEVLNAMLTNATRFKDNDYVIEVLRYMRDENVEPDATTVQLIRDFEKNCLAKLKKFRKPDKRTRNEFFKISRECQQWIKHFNVDRKTLIDTEELREQRTGHEIKVNARLSKKALELSQKHKNLKRSGGKPKQK